MDVSNAYVQLGKNFDAVAADFAVYGITMESVPFVYLPPNLSLLKLFHNQL